MKENWLLTYRSIAGINQILTQMDRRTQNQSKMRFATNELGEFYSDFEMEFTEFFKDLILFSNEKITTL
jgi:acyl carrier protein phosphodiesterase